MVTMRLDRKLLIAVVQNCDVKDSNMGEIKEIVGIKISIGLGYI